MSQRLYNFNASSGLMSQISIGGMPIFGKDLQTLNDNARVLSMNSMLKGWSVVLQGCQVDEINTSTKTVKVLPGIIQLATTIGDIQVSFDGYEGAYPFAIRIGSVTADDRVFKDGQLKNVGELYTYTTRDSFGTLNSAGYPTDLEAGEIYFDPFTDQRAEYVLSNLATGYRTLKQRYVTDSYLSIATTETGKPVVGSSISQLNDSGSYKYKHFGWSDIGQDADFKNRFAFNAEKGTLDLSTIGEESVKLSVNNLPQHQHETTTNGGNITTEVAGDHTHNFNWDPEPPVATTGLGNTQSAVSGPPSVDAIAELEIENAGSHTHTINGNTGKGVGIPTSAEEIDIRPRSIRVQGMLWEGYASALESGLSQIRPSFYNGTIYPEIF